MRNLKIIDSIEWVLVISFFMMLFVGLLQVIFRYAVQFPLFWSEELSRYLYIFATFLGASIASLTDGHIVVDALTSRVKKARVKKSVEFLSQMFSILIIGYFSFLSYKYLGQNVSHGTASPAMDMPMWIPIGSLLLGGALMTLFHIFNLIKMISNIKY